MADDSFRRWQQMAVEQRGSASSLMLGLSGGALAFTVSLIVGSKTGFIGTWSSAAFQLHAVFQLASISFCVAFYLNRLRDFHLTMRITRDRPDLTVSELGDLRSESQRLGKLTLKLFSCQCRSFFAGAIVFVLFALLRLSAYLY